MSDQPELLRRALEYCEASGLNLGDSLGSGIQGIVYAVERQSEKRRSAIKVHKHERAYGCERDVYNRLMECEITEIHDCAVPQMLRHDDNLWVIEMTIVAKPFVLDFASAYLDRPPDFSEEVMADSRAKQQEEFGPRWAEVQAILRFLEGYGVFLADVKPGNISFGD